RAEFADLEEPRDAGEGANGVDADVFWSQVGVGNVLETAFDIDAAVGADQEASADAKIEVEIKILTNQVTVGVREHKAGACLRVRDESPIALNKIIAEPEGFAGNVVADAIEYRGAKPFQGQFEISTKETAIGRRFGQHVAQLERSDSV